MSPLGLIRRATSLSTLGGVKYTSKREAQTKQAPAQARLAKAETKVIKGQARELKAEKQAAQRDAQAETWQPILDAITAGEASWDDLTRMRNKIADTDSKFYAEGQS